MRFPQDIALPDETVADLKAELAEFIRARNTCLEQREALIVERDALKARAEAAEAEALDEQRAVEALQAHVERLQRLGAEAGACITELLASVRMWRERAEALADLASPPDVSIREDASDAPLKPRSDNDSCRPSWAKDKS